MQVLEDRGSQRVHAKNRDLVLQLVSWRELEGGVEDDRADDADDDSRQDEGTGLGRRDGFQVPRDLQGRQDNGDRRRGQEAAGKGVALVEQAHVDQGDWCFGQEEADHQYRQEHQGLRVGKKQLQVQIDPGLNKEEGDKKAIADRGQLVLGCLGRL